MTNPAPLEYHLERQGSFLALFPKSEKKSFRCSIFLKRHCWLICPELLCVEVTFNITINIVNSSCYSLKPMR